MYMCACTHTHTTSCSLGIVALWYVGASGVHRLPSTPLYGYLPIYLTSVGLVVVQQQGTLLGHPWCQQFVLGKSLSFTSLGHWVHSADPIRPHPCFPKRAVDDRKVYRNLVVLLTGDSASYHLPSACLARPLMPSCCLCRWCRFCGVWGMVPPDHRVGVWGQYAVCTLMFSPCRACLAPPWKWL